MVVGVLSCVLQAERHCSLLTVMPAGKIRGLHGHRWLVVACETKLLMHDLSSNVSREVARTSLDNKAPSALAFLYINNPALLSEHSVQSPQC